MFWPSTPVKTANTGLAAMMQSTTSRVLPNAPEHENIVKTDNPLPSADSPSPRLPRNARLTMDEVDDIRLYGLTPELLHFTDIHSKAVRSRDDIDAAIALASDRKLIDDAALELNRHDSSEQQALARRRRIVLVNFLAFALTQGTESAHVAQVIRHFVKTASTAEGEPIEIRKTFAGDRIELLLTLKTFAPHEFERIRDEVEGTPAAKLVEYVAGIQARR
jgi:hypothetical protein